MPRNEAITLPRGGLAPGAGTELKIGDLARDRITQFEGTITAACWVLGGDVQVRLEAMQLKRGAPIEAWFPLDRLHPCGGDRD